MMQTDISALKFVGAGVLIYGLAKIARPEVVEIGEGTQIDDFVFINGGNGVRIGRFNHVASFVSVVGGGELIT
ncbi:MAG: acyltransferase, partial [Anaerolineae bacterium]